MKSFSPAVDAMLRGKVQRIAFLAEFALADTYPFWSGVGTLVYDGNSYTGVGRLGRIAGAGQTAEVRTVETSYELAGISDFAELNAFLEAPVRNKRAKAWLAFLDEAGAVIPDPILIDESILDVATPYLAEDGTAVMKLSGTSAMFYWSRPVGLMITHEQQQADYPGDTGFDRIPTEVASKQVAWTQT